MCQVEGTELFYTEAGTGLPCLVMHGGLGFDHTYLHPWLDALGDRMHLVYYDHRETDARDVHRSRRSPTTNWRPMPTPCAVA